MKNDTPTSSSNNCIPSRKWELARTSRSNYRVVSEALARSFRCNRWLLLRCLAFHDRVPLAAVGGHLELERVRGGRKHLHSVAPLHHFSAHLVLGVPGPGVALDGAGR